jgi:hypothetical protein
MANIPVGFLATTRTVARVEFVCRRCRFWRLAEITGTGQGSESFLNALGTAQRRAEEDARKDIVRILRRVRCPSCQKRNPGALWGFLRSWILMAALFITGGIAIGYAPTWFDVNMSAHDREICKWVMPLLVAVTLLFILPTMIWTKWSKTEERVRWLDGQG